MEQKSRIQSAEMSDPLAPQKLSFVRRFFALVRFLVFVSLIVLIGATIIPFGDEGATVITSLYFWTITGIVVVLVLSGIVFYFLTFQQTSAAIKTTVNLEVMAAIVIGMLAVIIIGVAVLLRSAVPPRVVGFGALLVVIYATYIYQMVKENLRAMKENEKIRRQYGALYEIDREKSNFITVTSHQLRTPLTEMKWSLEQLVREKGVDDAARGTLERYRESLDRFIAIVNDMVAAQPGGGGKASQQDIVEVAVLLQGIVNSLAGLAEQKETNLVLTDIEKDLVVRGEQIRLRRAFEAIVDNAVRYAPKGSVRVSAKRSGGNVVVRIEDSGIGILAKDYPRVFKRFFRGENALLVEPNGSGLGLFNAKRIIEDHGGSIDFTSVEKKGSAFTVTIPSL